MVRRKLDGMAVGAVLEEHGSVAGAARALGVCWATLRNHVRGSDAYQAALAAGRAARAAVRVDDETLGRVRAAGTVETAARALGVHEQTLRRHLRRHSALRQALETGRTERRTRRAAERALQDRRVLDDAQQWVDRERRALAEQASGMFAQELVRRVAALRDTEGVARAAQERVLRAYKREDTEAPAEVRDWR